MTSPGSSPQPGGQVEHLTDDGQAPKPSERANAAIIERLSILDPSKRAQVEKRVADVPKSARLGYLRAPLGEGSPRQAIKAFCLECMGWDRAEVAQCTARACPLYEYRPFAVERKNNPAGESVKNDG